MSAIHYFERWLPLEGRGHRPLPSNAARDRHASREAYAAVLGDPAAPQAAIELRADGVAVYFLNSDRTPAFLYSFKAAEAQKLFLSQIVVYHYKDGQSRPFRLQVMAFSHEGTMLAEDRDIESDQAAERRGTVDVADHWETAPSFGNYSGLLQQERHRTNW